VPSNRVEWPVFLLGCGTSFLLAWLRRTREDAAFFLPGLAVALTLGRNARVAGLPYSAAVQRR
jgi:hypothetical protein